MNDFKSLYALIEEYANQPTQSTESIKLKWQQHNRDHGLSWNEVGELVNEVANQPTQSTEEVEGKLKNIMSVLDDFLGDTDPYIDEDMTDDDICQEEPIFWAHTKLCELLDNKQNLPLLTPQPEQPPKQVSEEEIDKSIFRLINKLQILFEAERSELGFLDMTKKGLADSVRISELYDQKKAMHIKQTIHSLYSGDKSKLGIDMKDILKQFGEFMWNCSDLENDHDLAIGYDENGNANSVSLEIHGRTHSEFKLNSLYSGEGEEVSLYNIERIIIANYSDNQTSTAVQSAWDIRKLFQPTERKDTEQECPYCTNGLEDRGNGNVVDCDFCKGSGKYKIDSPQDEQEEAKKENKFIRDYKKLIIELEANRDEYHDLKHQDGDRECEAIFKGKYEAYSFMVKELQNLIDWHKPSIASGLKEGGSDESN